MTPNLNLGALESAAKAATEGEWFEDKQTGFLSSRDEDGEIYLIEMEMGFNTLEDREFCALANPSTILELISYIRQLEARNGTAG
jgi:hypothetical protein